MRDHDPKVFTRRDALVALAASGATLAGCAHPALAKSAPPPSPAPGAGTGGVTGQQPGVPLMPSPSALTGTHTVLPLPFKPTALNGISEKMIVSHHDNNYAGAVKNLNKVEEQLGSVNKDTPASWSPASRSAS